MKKIVIIVSLFFLLNTTFAQENLIFDAVKTNNIESVDSLIKINPDIVKLKD